MLLSNLSFVFLTGQLAQLVTILSSLASLAPVTSTADLEELEVRETKFENCFHPVVVTVNKTHLALSFWNALLIWLLNSIWLLGQTLCDWARAALHSSHILVSDYLSLFSEIMTISSILIIEFSPCLFPGLLL